MIDDSDYLITSLEYKYRLIISRHRLDTRVDILSSGSLGRNGSLSVPRLPRDRPQRQARQIETDTETDRQTETQTERETDRDTEKILSAR